MKTIVKLAVPRVLKSARKTMFFTSLPVVARSTADLIKTKIQNCNKISRMQEQHQAEIAKVQKKSTRRAVIAGASGLVIGSAIGYASSEANRRAKNRNK